MVCTDDTQWATLAGLLGREDLAGLTTAERIARSTELDELVARWTAGQDSAALQELLQIRGVAAHQVQHSPEYLADPQLLHRGHFYRTAHPKHGTAWVEGPNVLFSDTPGRAAWAGPTLGQHTDHVLRNVLGYNDDQITDGA